MGLWVIGYGIGSGRPRPNPATGPGAARPAGHAAVQFLGAPCSPPFQP